MKNKLANKFKLWDRKTRVLVEIILISLVVALCSASYAFFSVSGIPQGKDTVITTGTMRLEFADGQEVVASDLTPGHSITKTFKVKNIGNVETMYDIYFSEVINSFFDKNDLVYTVSSSSGCAKTAESVVPSESGEKAVSNCSITPNQEHSYTLTITFKETDDNQNDNLSRTFSAKLAANEYNITRGLVTANAYVDEATKFYSLNSTSSDLGSDLASTLDVEDKLSNDKVVITKDGSVELAIKRDNHCFRKSALSDNIDIIDEELCNANINNFVSNSGHLHTSENKLIDENGNEVRLTGATVGSIEKVNKTESDPEDETNVNSLHTLHNWGANIARIFVNAKKSYIVSYIGSEEAYTDALEARIREAIANDMYVLVNWDPAGNNGETFTDSAVQLFTELSRRFANDPHIIYELWNEPEKTSTWNQITAHANAIIPSIRQYSSDALIISGSPSHDMTPGEIKDHKLTFDNIAYSYHLYMNGLASENIDPMIETYTSGIPLIVTEWGSMFTGVKSGPAVIEEYAPTFAKILNKYNISHMFFAFGSSGDENDIYGNKYGIVLTGNWDNRLPDSILRPNGKFLKSVLSGGTGNYNTNLFKENSTDTGTDYRSSEYREKIVSIKFENTLYVPDNASVEWDLSYAGDNSIIGYLVPSEEEGLYDMTIAANGNINAPNNSNYLFSGLTNLRSIDFNGFTTNYTAHISQMFSDDLNLLELDLKGFNSSNILQMWNTFANCKKLKSIDLSGWNPKLTYGWGSTFYECNSLEKLDLSSFDVSNVKSFAGLFYQNKSLKELNISTWSPTTVSTVRRMLYACKNLEKIDISGMEITSSTEVTQMLTYAKSGITVKVKNQDVADILSATATNPVNFVTKE